MVNKNKLIIYICKIHKPERLSTYHWSVSGFSLHISDSFNTLKSSTLILLCAGSILILLKSLSPFLSETYPKGMIYIIEIFSKNSLKINLTYQMDLK